MTSRSMNWARNVSYQAERLLEPTTLSELRATVAGHPRVRVLGSRHSFNTLPDTAGAHVSLTGMPAEIEIDSAAATARVSAGMRYAELAARLDSKGFALPTMASLPHLSVAGACVTATHGCGVGNRVLAASIRELELVTADGDLITIDRAAPEYPGAAVNLGMLGVLHRVTLDLVPSFEVAKTVYQDLPFSVLDEHFVELMSGAYSVGLFTDWRQPSVNQTWVARRAKDPEPDVVRAPWFTATPATEPLHPVFGLPAESCTEQLGALGPWFQRLPHFRAEFTPSAGEELQSEYMLARDDAPAALRALERIRDHIHPVLLTCEIRTIAADEFWMSPCYQQDTIAFHFTWIPDEDRVFPVVSMLEEQLAEFRAKPHWAKVFTMSAADIEERYPRLPDFRELVRRFDPAGKFRNEFSDRYLGIG